MSKLLRNLLARHISKYYRVAFRYLATGDTRHVDWWPSRELVQSWVSAMNDNHRDKQHAIGLA
jgi:hypothetical protein